MKRRYGIFAAATASALMIGAVSAPATAAVPDFSVLVTGGTNASANAVPALPAGLRYVKVSAGTTQTLYLRSDGQVVGAGNNTNGSLDIPALPAGQTYTDVEGTGDITVLLRSDGNIVYASKPYAQPLYVPTLPAGLRYTKIFSSGSVVTALRSDGRAVIFRVYFDDRTIPAPAPAPTATATPTPTATATASPAPTATPTATATATATPTPTPTATPAPTTNPNPAYFERITEDTDYRTGAVGGSDYVILLHATGKAKAVDLRATRPSALPQATVPKLPSGLRFTAVDASSNVAAYVRTDGQVVTAGTTSKGSIRIPNLPKGVTYRSANVGDFTVALVRSDGQAVLSGFSDNAGITPTLPKVAKGQRFTAVSDNASRVAYQLEKLQPNVKVQTSISSVSRPTTVKWGSTATYRVKVFSTAATKGGQVKVTYKNRTIGTGTIGDGAVATISVSSTSFPKVTRNKVGISFLGTGNANKSSSGTKYVGYIRTKR